MVASCWFFLSSHFDATITLVLSVCVRPSVRMEYFVSHVTDLKIFCKSLNKIQVSLQSDNNNGYFARRPIYICDDILLISSLKQKCFREKIKFQRKSKHILRSIIFFFFENLAVYEIMWNIKYCRAGQATYGNMAHAHCMLDTLGYRHTLRICNIYCFSTANKRIPKATDTHSEYVIIIPFTLPTNGYLRLQTYTQNM